MKWKLKTLLPAAVMVVIAGLGAASDAQAQVKLRWAHVGTANAPSTSSS